MTRFQMIEKRMSDEEGDFRMHSKKDDAMGEKNKCCGSTHGYTKQSDGTLKCVKCGKVMNPVRLESCGKASCKCKGGDDCNCKKGKKCSCASVPQKQYDAEWGKTKKSKFESYMSEAQEIHEFQIELIERLETIFEAELVEDSASIANSLGMGISGLAKVVGNLKGLSDIQIIMGLLQHIDSVPNPKAKETIKALGVKYKAQIDKIKANNDSYATFKKAANAPRQYDDEWGGKRAM